MVKSTLNIKNIHNNSKLSMFSYKNGKNYYLFFFFVSVILNLKSRGCVRALSSQNKNT